MKKEKSYSKLTPKKTVSKKTITKNKAISRRAMLGLILGTATAATGAIALDLTKVKLDKKTKDTFLKGMDEKYQYIQAERRRD
ncbi:MAG: hypothetical protein ABIA04_12595 [Pseudomonadota bacterium]